MKRLCPECNCEFEVDGYMTSCKSCVTEREKLYDPALMHLIFVYGTIKRGFRNHFRVFNGETRHEFVGTAVTDRRLGIIYSDGLPYLVEMPGDGRSKQIHGEVFRVNGELLRYLDRLETHPVHYKRTMIRVQVANEAVLASVYLASQETMKRHRLMEKLDCDDAELMDNFDVPEWRDGSYGARDSSEKERSFAKENTPKLLRKRMRLATENPSSKDVLLIDKIIARRKGRTKENGEQE